MGPCSAAARRACAAKLRDHLLRGRGHVTIRRAQRFHHSATNPPEHVRRAYTPIFVEFSKRADVLKIIRKLLRFRGWVWRDVRRSATKRAHSDIV